MKFVDVSLVLSLTFCFPAEVVAQQCVKSRTEANIITRVSDALAALGPNQQLILLRQVGCDLNNFRSLEDAVKKCSSCSPKFGCDMVDVLYRAGKLRAADTSLMACS